MFSKQKIQILILIILLLILIALLWFNYKILFPSKRHSSEGINIATTSQITVAPPVTNPSPIPPHPPVLTNLKPVKPPIKITKEMTQNYNALIKAEKIHEWLMAMEKCHGITGAHTSKKVVALTFDDGPNGKYTENVLEVLNKYQIKATFFLIGQNAARYPDLVKTLLAEQHVIGNHTLEHLRLSSLRDTQISHELNATNSIIYHISGVVPALFRPPFGMCSVTSARITSELGFKTITWSNTADDYDIKKTTPENIASFILKRIKPGQIITLHDGGGNREKTVAALPIIIETLQNKGYQFLTVPELLQINPYQLEITDHLVTWGYAKNAFAKQKKRPIDTLIIYTGYNSLSNDPHDLNGVLKEQENKNVTPHYLITREGVIYRLATDETIAYHSANRHLNKFAIGIEIINGQDEVPTPVQSATLVHLIKVMQSIYQIKYIYSADQLAFNK